MVFNGATFIARYPEFTASYNANPAYYGSLFNEATLYLDNTACSIVQDVTKRAMFLNMLVAHIAFLGGALTADGQPKPVGMVKSASQGSVNASFDYPLPAPGSGEWLAQSQYGIAFWQATTSYRGARYFPNPTKVEGFTGTRLGTEYVPGLTSQWSRT